jgi:hypothetical protein
MTRFTAALAMTGCLEKQVPTRFTAATVMMS